MRMLARNRHPFVHWFVAAAIAASAAARSQDPPKPTAGAVPVAGGELHYEVRGDGPPIVLLSGGPGFANYLQPVADALVAGHRCILFDQRGTGASQSEKLDASPTLANAIADLETLRVHLQLERWSLLGHSWGGMLAMAYATQHPDRLDSLVLVGTGGPTLDFYGPFGDTLTGRATPEDVAALAKWNDPETVAQDPDLAAKERLRIRFPAYFYSREKAVAAWSDFAKVQFAPSTFGAMMDDLRRQNFDLRGGLEQVRCRALVVHGRQDAIPASVVYEIRDVMPQVELQFIEKSGHFPWLEQPEATFRVLRTFLAKH